MSRQGYRGARLSYTELNVKQHCKSTTSVEVLVKIPLYIVFNKKQIIIYLELTNDGDTYWVLISHDAEYMMRVL